MTSCDTGLLEPEVFWGVEEEGWHTEDYNNFQFEDFLF